MTIQLESANGRLHVEVRDDGAGLVAQAVMDGVDCKFRQGGHDCLPAVELLPRFRRVLLISCDPLAACDAREPVTPSV